LRLVEESLTAGLSVADFARQQDIHPNLIHAWRRFDKALSEVSGKSSAASAPIGSRCEFLRGAAEPGAPQFGKLRPQVLDLQRLGVEFGVAHRSTRPLRS
jgi:transposase-like protein